MEHCRDCGRETVEGARFCFYCGARVPPREYQVQALQGNRDDLLLELPLPPQTEVARAVADSLDAPEESIAFASSGPIFVDNKKWDAYVTTRRLVLHRSVGLVFTKESQQEVDLSKTHRVAVKEEGTLLKEFSLEVDDLAMKGRKSDVANMYRAVQAARARLERR